MIGKGVLLAAALSAAAIVASASAAAAGPAWEFTSPGTSFNNDDWDFAAAFTVNSTVTVSGLGYYADPYNGQVDSNPVALYQCADVGCDSTATLLASAVVTNIYPLNGHFRYVTIPNVTLNPGVGYEVAGASFADNYTWNDPGFTTDPAINYPLDQTRWQLGTTPDFLNYVNYNEIESDGFWGPNIYLGSSTGFTGGVPEPATWASLMIGLFGVGAVLRSRRKLAAASAVA